MCAWILVRGGDWRAVPAGWHEEQESCAGSMQTDGQSWEGAAPDGDSQDFAGR